MNKSDSIQNLAVALNKAQAEMPHAPMNATNPFLKNKYADLGSVIETSKPILAKHGLSVSQLPTSHANEIGLETILMHDSGEWISNTIYLQSFTEKGKSAAQVAGSIISYLRRYSLASVLGIYADEDTDGNRQQQKSIPATKHRTPSNELPEIEYGTAIGVKTSKGDLYVNMDNVTLSAVVRGINTAIEKETDPQRIDELKFKKAAALCILNHDE